MLKEILVKDIRIMLKEFKFQLFFAIIFVLFILSGFTSAVRHNNAMQEYLSVKSNREANARQLSSEILSMIHRDVITYINQPDISGFIHTREGFPQSLSTNTIVYSPKVETPGKLSKEVFNLNWMFIISILSSFIVLIFSFNTVSSEKINGMLRLQTSYGVSRSNIILSKYFSLLICYLFCIIPSSVISLLLFFLITGSFNLVIISKILIFLIVSIIYISFFIFLGIYISLVKNFRSSIVIAMTMWLLFIVIIPNSVGIIAKRLSPILTENEFNTQFNNRFNQVFSEWSKKYDDDSPTGSKVRGNGFMQEGLRYAAILDADKQANTILYDYVNSKLNQINLADKLELFSPYGHLRLFSEILFNQGIYRLKNELFSLEQRFNLIHNELNDIDIKDERSLNQMYKWANWDRYALTEVNLVPFTDKPYPHPEKLVFSEIFSGNLLSGILSGSVYVISLIVINLLMFILVFLKFKKLDIR